MKRPGLKSRVDDYRIRNYRLQQSEKRRPYDAVDSLGGIPTHSTKARRQTLILRRSLRSVRWYRRCRTVFQKKSASAYRKSKTENQKESAHVRKRKGMPDTAQLTGAKGTVRLLIYVCVILVIILVAKTSYQFGHEACLLRSQSHQRKRKGSHRTGAFRHGGERTWRTPERQRTDRRKAFWFSKSSTACPATTAASRTVPYVLNTAQTVDEMLEILAGVNTEGQPSAE